MAPAYEVRSRQWSPDPEGPEDGVLIEHNLDAVGRVVPAGLDADDGGGVPPPGDEVGLAGRVAMLPLRLNPFCPSFKTV